MDKLYNKMLSDYYGINCNNCYETLNSKHHNLDNLTDEFWILYSLKNLNLNKTCQTKLQTLLV